MYLIIVFYRPNTIYILRLPWNNTFFIRKSIIMYVTSIQRRLGSCMAQCNPAALLTGGVDSVT